MRILGLDYGGRRIGIALSDEMGLTAQGLPTLERKTLERDLTALGEIIRQRGVEKIVIGYPLRLDGTEGIQCRKVDRFVEALEGRFALPVIRWDETLTTRQAEEVLSEARAKRKKRKSAVDKIAAMFILQGYLEALRKGSAP